MKRENMICTKCVKFDGFNCRYLPEPVPIHLPERHWCAQGQWMQWSDRYKEMEPFFWGEWDDPHFTDR